MSWASPRVYVVGQVMTVAIMNEISDNLKFLKGSVGTVAIDAGVTASGLIEATDGMVASGRISGATHLSVSGIVTAGAGIVTPTHVSAAGNVQVAGTVDGVDLSQHNTGRSGNHGVLCVLSGRIAAVNCGSYTGTGSGENYVAHGLGRYARFISIQAVASGYQVGHYIGPYYSFFWWTAASFARSPSAGGGNTTFAVGTTTSGANQVDRMNGSGIVYYWAAVG